MKKQVNWMLPMTGALLATAATSLAQDSQTYNDSTNRLTLSMRFGWNIKGTFKGIGSTGNPFAAAPTRFTPNGDAYNYDDGYVYPDSSGSVDGQTWYWGYDNASQVSGNNILLSHTAVSGIPSKASDDTDNNPGFELTYNREIGVIEELHHMRYGVEGAVSYMPIAFSTGGMFNVNATRTTDYYAFTPGTTPPAAPYQGDFAGPGFLISSTPNDSSVSSVPGASLLAQDRFDANLWGLRFGPYVEFPLCHHVDLHVSAGLALGLIDANATWRETYNIPGTGTSTVSGHGTDFDVLWGGYLSGDVSYQFNERWAVEVGAQLQDLGTYRHNFDGRGVVLDLSKSVFVEAGVSYSF